MGAQSGHFRKLGLDFAAAPGIHRVMPSDHDPTPEDMIAQLLPAAGFLMEEISPELAMSVLPTRDALEARIAVVERAAEEVGAIVATARAILRLVHR